MSNTTFLKLLIVIVLAIILFPVGLFFLVGLIGAFTGSPLFLFELLMMVIPSYLILIYFEKKQPLVTRELPQSKLDLILNRILQLEFGLAIIYIVYVLPGYISTNPHKMMFIFAVVLPLCALYLKLSNKPAKKQGIDISNFKER